MYAFVWELPDVLRFESPTGPFEKHPDSSGGADHVYSADYQFGEGLPWLRVTYLDAGRPVADETVELR